ncbi:MULTISPECIES: YncE family protein [unclassified Pseudomonas]|uniref:YncE family protein n=1 Tax=unclassified Pseudomonas TaxID=196821 RepID=UPI0008EAC9F6|nr:MULTISPECIES: YncE family protein [unclassified Pseudomonas]SFA83878.1 40-residue YVTN family beta-propeller repeat-containing protein [Pseudomonas sp. NFPP24]SFO78493.1 40-residue YVTN family beta-propeller repeat-containing protein [Pseudomonas sp. NFPP28]
MTTVTGTPITTNFGTPKTQDEEVYEFDLSKPEHIPPVAFEELSLNIPGLRQPYTEYDGGINKAAKNLHPEKGLLCILNPYLDMIENDFVELFFGSAIEPAAFTTVSATQASAGLSISLYVSLAWLEYGPVFPCFFRVTRAGGGDAETKKFRFFVDDVEPAGPNPDDATYHDYITAPQLEKHIIENGVQPEDAQMGVKIQIHKYPNRQGLNPLYDWAAQDTIWLRLNGHVVRHEVTEDEAKGTAPITITVYDAKWKEVGYGAVIIQHYVIDKAGNKTVSPSPLTIVESFVGNPHPLLAPPFIAEVNDEGKVDIGLLDGEDATIVINVPGNDFLKFDVIKVIAVGYTAAGTRVEKEYTGTIDSVFTNKYISLPFKDLETLVGGTLRIHFERMREGVTPHRRSRVNVYDIIGHAIPVELPPAIILQAPDGNIPADSASITVWINHYPGQDPSDAVMLILIGTYANGAGYYREVGPRPAGTGNIIFNITNGPNGDIAGLEGGTLDVHYSVTNEAGTRPSEPATFDVGELVPSFDPVEIEEAPKPDYVFDPSVSLFGATVFVKRNSAFTQGSTVTLHFEGSAAGGSTTKPFLIIPIWVGRDLYFDIERSVVVKNLDKSARLYYTLTKANERTRISHAVDMRVGAPLNLPVPQILESTVIEQGKSATMNPVHVLNPPVATYRVRYKMLNSDLIQPYFTGKPGLGTPTITPKYGNAADGFVDFQISNSVIAANLERHVIVQYRVTRGNAKLLSDPLDLEIQALPNSAANVVSIPQASGGQVDANTANTVQVLEYPFMQRGQPVWISFEHDDGTPDYLVRDGDPVTLTEYNSRKIVTSIPNDYLKSRPNGSLLRIKTQVSMDGLNSQNSTVRLYAPPYSIKRQAGIVAHIDVGATPRRLVLSPDGSRVYVTNHDSHTISVISTASHKVIHTITGLNRPYAITVSPDGGRLYVCNLGSQRVTVINTTNYAFINQIPGFAAPYSILLNKDGSRLYVSCNASHAVYTHDALDGRRLHTLSGYTNAAGLAFNPSQTRLYAGTRNTLFVIDPQSNAAVASISGFTNPRDMAYSPHNTSTNPTLYVANSSGASVHIINAGSNTRRSILSDFSNPFGIVMHPTQPLAYVTDYNNNTVKIIDTIQERVIDAISGFNGPYGVAISNDGSTLYVINGVGGTVAVLNT